MTGVRLLELPSLEERKKKMQEIGVDSSGIEIMLPKTNLQLLETDKLSNFAANILKQESLSLGADAAVSRKTLTGGSKQSPVLLFGTQAQLIRLSEKLKRQPFGLDRIGIDIKQILQNSYKDNLKIKAGDYTLKFNKRTYIMGIINITPDSFSGDGLYGERQDKILAYAEKLIADGVDILDIGGESTRPGAKSISLKEELNRTIPIIKRLSKRLRIPISIDTYKSEVARCAIDNGASIVNDISGLRFDAKMPDVISRTKAACVIMHIKGKPKTMQRNPRYKDLMSEITNYFKKSIDIAQDAGIEKDRIIIDPGIGFGKSLGDNLTILKRLRELKSLGLPILIGVSRKSFIGSILNLPPQERLMGTAASVAFAISQGVNIVRVHDVKEIVQVAKIIDAIKLTKIANPH